MQTVQEAFRNANKDELIRHYLYEHPIKIDDCSDDTTFGEAKAIARKRLGSYIDRLRQMEPKKPEDGYQDLIFYVYHYLHDGITTPDFALSTLSDLRQKGTDAPTYGCEFTEQAEIMGYHIADNKLTKYYMTELLVDIMFEASFFGFHQEHLQDEIDELEQAEKEIDEGQTMTEEEFFRELGLEDLDDFSPQEEKYCQKVREYQEKISDHSKMTEIRQILQGQIQN